jgi:large subunit ribosomal protein L24
MNIRSGDTVVVITGKDKGKTGRILRVLSEKDRVIVGGINMRTKHIKASSQRAGQIVRYEASIHVSNVMLVDPKTKKRTRIGFVLDGGKKKRIAKRSGTVISGAAKVAARPAKEAAEAKRDTTAKKTAKAPEAQAPPPKKQPFWKRMGFGAEAVQEAEAQQAPPPEERGHDQVPMTRSSGRGS